MDADRRPRDRSEEYLLRLGLETARDTAARWAAEGHTEEARRLREWAEFSPTRGRRFAELLGTTRGGNPRALRLGMCGVAFAATADGKYGWERRGCRDRHCPTCGAKRSRQITACIREHVEEKGVEEDCAFGNFTQPKDRGESCRDAVTRVLATWRVYSRGAWFRANVVGGLRSVEATARAKDERVGDYVVRVPGIHAHIHAILQLRRLAPTPCPPGVPELEHVARERVANLEHQARLREQAAEAWVEASGGSLRACKVEQVTPGNISQVGNYCVNLEGLVELADVAPEYVKTVCEGLRGRHLVFCFGSWRGILRDHEPGTLRFGNRSIPHLVTDPAQQTPVQWCGGGETPAVDVLRAVMESRRPLRQPRAPGKKSTA